MFFKRRHKNNSPRFYFVWIRSYLGGKNSIFTCFSNYFHGLEILWGVITSFPHSECAPLWPLATIFTIHRGEWFYLCCNDVGKFEFLCLCNRLFCTISWSYYEISWKLRHRVLTWCDEENQKCTNCIGQKWNHFEWWK